MQDPLLDILDGALSLETEAERESYVQERCQGDQKLLAKVKRLLHEESTGEDWDLRKPRDLMSPILTNNQFPLLGQRIGPWKLIQVLGEGGMGTVYMGERIDEAFAQQVAVKVIRQDVEKRHVLERFQKERQIHAGLDHPSIAALLDAGHTRDNAPYFVMEYVPGQRIDQHCDQKDLNAKERIELFMKVCSVVHDTQEMGVMHRDLKPSNIMVQPNGKVKLLDFGVALMMRAGVPTGEGELPFVTPAYASPESLNHQAISKASDQYSLAVILQELLTDRRPLANQDSSKPGTDSPTLSAALAGSIGHLATGIGQLVTQGLDPEERNSSTEAAERNRNIGKLRRGALAGYPERSRFLRDFRAILGRGLHANPRNRYATVEDMRLDLQRMLAGDLVKAQGATFWESVQRKWTQNRLAITGVTALILVLITSLAYTKQKGRDYDRLLAASKTSTRMAGSHADVMENFAEKILEGLDYRLRNVPGALPLREKILTIGTEFFENLGPSDALPDSLLRSVLEAYRHLGIMRVAPMEGGPSQVSASLEAFEKAFALVPRLEATDPKLGRYFKALILLDHGSAEKRQLRFVAAADKLARALEIYENKDFGIEQIAPEHYMRALLEQSLNFEEMGQSEAARNSLDRFESTRKKVLSHVQADDPYLRGSLHLMVMEAANLHFTLGDIEKARNLFEEIVAAPWSHPGSESTEHIYSYVGRLHLHYLKWKLGDPSEIGEILAEIDESIEPLESQDIHKIRFRMGLAQLYSLKAQILKSQGDLDGALAALGSGFRLWRYSIRLDPRNAHTKRELVAALIMSAEILSLQGDTDSNQLQSLWEEARAHLEGLRRLKVDDPLVESYIQRIDKQRF